MPDIFDNFFGKLSTTMHGGKSKPRYGGASQVNSGPYYSYHNSTTNNKYWLPKKKPDAKMQDPMDSMNLMAPDSMKKMDAMDTMDTMEHLKDLQPSVPKQRMDSITSMASNSSDMAK